MTKRKEASMDKKKAHSDFSLESSRQRVARLKELNIQQADLPTDREPTLEEEIRCNEQIRIATRQIREAQAAGLLMLPKNYVSQGFYQPSIKEYRKVTRNNLPLYS